MPTQKGLYRLLQRGLLLLLLLLHQQSYLNQHVEERLKVNCGFDRWIVELLGEHQVHIIISY